MLTRLKSGRTILAIEVAALRADAGEKSQGWFRLIFGSQEDIEMREKTNNGLRHKQLIQVEIFGDLLAVIDAERERIAEESLEKPKRATMIDAALRVHYKDKLQELRETPDLPAPRPPREAQTSKPKRRPKLTQAVYA